MIDFVSPASSSMDAPPPIADARELLSEFATTGRQQPFEEIVRRYGGMVYNLCYEVTGNRHDAEDAVQAAFLSLAVQVRAGQNIQAIGPWLQQVARRLALDLNRSRRRRKKREERHSETWEMRKIDAGLSGNGNGQTPPEAAAGWEELRHIIQQELNELPPKYRMPLILHYYGGLSRDEMARELGCRANTLGVRLHRGREMLGKRLARRGVELSSLIFGVLMAEVVHSVVSERLVACTAQAAVLYSAGHPYACGLVSSDVVSLAKRAAGALAVTKIKMATMLAILAGGAAAAGAQIFSTVGYTVPRPSTWHLDNLFRDWFKAPPLPEPRVDSGGHAGSTDVLVQGDGPSSTPTRTPAPPRYGPAPVPGPTPEWRYTTQNGAPGVWSPSIPSNNSSNNSATAQRDRTSPGIPVVPYAPPAPRGQQGIANGATGGGFDAPAGGGRGGAGGTGGGGGAGGGTSKDSNDAPRDRKLADRKPHGDKPEQQDNDPRRGGVKPEPRPQEQVKDGSPKPGGLEEAPVTHNRPVHPQVDNPPPSPYRPSTPAGPVRHPNPSPIPTDDANQGEYQIPGPNPPVLNSGPGGYDVDGVWHISGAFKADAPDSFESIAAAGSGPAMFSLAAGSSAVHKQVFVGYAGTGVARQTGGEHTVDSLYLGVVKTGRGQYELTGGTLAVTRGPSGTDAPAHTIEIGTAGEGRFLLGGAASTGAIVETGTGSGVNMTVGVTRAAQASIRGWGKVALTGELVNNGQVIADAYGQSRTLDLSSFSGVRHDFVNRGGDARGWYAKNGGKLALPAIAVAPGTHTYTWGNNPDGDLTMVNSARVTLTGVAEAGTLDISLLALDRADTPAFPAGHRLVGVWGFDGGALAASGGMDLLVRYDAALAAEMGLDENVLKLWKYDGAWQRLDFEDTFVRDPLHDTLAVHTGIDGVGYFAVSAPEPGTVGVLVVGLGLYLGRRRRKLTPRAANPL